jgi:hypothetical protein
LAGALSSAAFAALSAALGGGNRGWCCGLDIGGGVAASHLDERQIVRVADICWVIEGSREGRGSEQDEDGGKGWCRPRVRSLHGAHACCEVCDRLE